MAGSATLEGEKFEVNKNQQNDEILLILRVQHKTLPVSDQTAEMQQLAA
jgi:hypothetical protein